MKPEELEALAGRLDAILEGIEELGETGVRAAVAELVEGLRRIHAEGLRRMVGLLAEDGERLGRALRDPVISNLLLLHGLSPAGRNDRPEPGPETARPTAASRGGGSASAREPATAPAPIAAPAEEPPAPKTGARNGARTLPLLGPRSVVPADRARRLQSRLERSREGAPGRAGPARAGSVRSGRERARSASAPPRLLEVADPDELTPGELHGRLVENEPILLIRRPDGIRAYRNLCPGSMLPLHVGTLEEGRIRCPWHGCRFDADSGVRVEGEGPGLRPFAVTVAEGRVRVEVP